MKLSLTPNAVRLKHRRNEVMETAWRARNYDRNLLTREAAEFIKFGSDISKSIIRG